MALTIRVSVKRIEVTDTKENNILAAFKMPSRVKEQSRTGGQGNKEASQAC